MRWRIDLLSDIGNDKYPFPSNIGRVMSVSIKIHVLNIHIVRDILKLKMINNYISLKLCDIFQLTILIRLLTNFTSISHVP